MKRWIVFLLGAIILTGCQTIPSSLKMSAVRMTGAGGRAIGRISQSGFYFRAYDLMSRGEYKEAREKLDEIIERNSDYTTAYIARSVLSEIEADYDEAINDLTIVLKLDSENKQAYFNRGNLFIRKEEYSKALINYTMCIKYDSSYAPAYLNRAFVYVGQKRYSEALRDLEVYLTLSDKQGDLVRELIKRIDIKIRGGK